MSLSKRAPWNWAIALALFAVLCLETYGFSLRNLFTQHIWDAVGLERLAYFAGLFVAVAVPILWVVPRSFAGLAIGLVLLGTAISVGPGPLLAVALFLVSSCTIGMKVLRQEEAEPWESQILATLMGMGTYIFLMYLMARLPVNYPAVWGAVLLAPVLLDWRNVRRRAITSAGRLRSIELQPRSQRWAAAFFLFVIMMHWLVVLEPDKSADGLAMHLAIASNVAVHHQFTYRPAVFIWSVMPMGADFAYSIVYLMGGEFAARLLNFAMLLLLVGLLYTNLRRMTSPPVCLLLAAVFATTPLVQLVTGSLMVENMMGAMLLGMLSALWRFGETGGKGLLYAVMVLGGTALSIKLGALSFLAVALPWLIVEAVRHWGSIRPRAPAVCLLAMAAFLALALPAYTIAWWKTGNPIFPFKNERIHSPLIDPTVQFQDNEFRRPLTWITPFDLTFRSHTYYEGQDGAFGFQYLAFLLIELVTWPLVRSRRTTLSLLTAIGASILILNSEPNARYVYAAMPLLFIPYAGVLGWLQRNQRGLYRAALGLAMVCGALNVYFMPGSGWYHKDFYMPSPFSPGGRERYTREYIPIRSAIRRFNDVHPGSALFLGAEEDVADSRGDVYEAHWHQYFFLLQLREARTLPVMKRLFEKWGVRYFTSRKAAPGERSDPELLTEFLEKCTVLEYQVDAIRLTRLDPSACASADR